ncbi:TIGR03618 family F420-dependent PPOX class oxidoreductase [Amycolatopsis sp. NPDC051903]|uniref:TIGR03618 family F420-dependent PPOX class oxidoreductase n=1 Tax=Amycolatopsis sp. NPDC051903 TaxID=3363936 RepID=UPI0037A1D19A
MELPAELLELLEKPSLCFIATSMPDGSPQLTQTWVDTDGKHVLVNTVEGFRKVRNVARDPRVALNVVDAERPYRYFVVRGRVLEATTEGGAEHIEKLAQRYTGRPYAWYGGRDKVRVLWKIEAEHISSVGA